MNAEQKKPYSRWSAIRSVLVLAAAQGASAQKHEELSAMLDHYARELDDHITANEALTTPTTAGEPVATHVCGGSGTLTAEARAELDDYATYLRLKARFDKRRSLSTNQREWDVVVERDVMRQAISAMCQYCRDGLPRHRVPSDPTATFPVRVGWHYRDGHDVGPCAALPLHDLFARIPEDTPAADQRARGTVTDAMVEAAAKALSRSHAALCGTDEADTWNEYYDLFRADARAALTAAMQADAARTGEAEG